MQLPATAGKVYEHHCGAKLQPNIEMTPRAWYVFAALSGLFAALAVLTNSVGIKPFEFLGLTLPVSIFWFPLMFLVTDIVSEVYGSWYSYFLVAIGFGASILFTCAAFLGVSLDPSPLYPANAAYVQVFGPAWRMVFASMVAYILAQNVDVYIFHVLKHRTQGRFLWLRNNVSTMVSQGVDTFSVTFLAYFANPAIFSGTLADILRLSFMTYLLKLILALLDTPLCYLGVGVIRRFVSKDSSVE